ncbi:hypothetical protein HPB47_002844 [Ixodes persulcatus]|uniref:Uncharacterized protein n=1 Tax=Ixodes persulcatus TaxID=34615 RepID=A0AC60PK90_IXOPE|nr:hypothetical protein HPB47_002844 [Ixodes persulcatus]
MWALKWPATSTFEYFFFEGVTQDVLTAANCSFLTLCQGAADCEIHPGRIDPAGIQPVQSATSARTEQQRGATEPLRLGLAALASWRFLPNDRSLESKGIQPHRDSGENGGEGGEQNNKSFSFWGCQGREAELTTFTVPSVNVVSLPAVKAHRTSVIRAPHVGLSRSTLLLARSVLRRRDFSSGCSWVLPGDRRLRTTNNCGVGHSGWFRCGVGENVWLEHLLDLFSKNLGDRE